VARENREIKGYRRKGRTSEEKREAKARIHKGSEYFGGLA